MDTKGYTRDAYLSVDNHGESQWRYWGSNKPADMEGCADSQNSSGTGMMVAASLICNWALKLFGRQKY